MKGDLTQFKAKVNTVMSETYKNYKNDVIRAIGYMPEKKIDSKEQVKSNENEIVQEEAPQVQQDEGR